MYSAKVRQAKIHPPEAHEDHSWNVYCQNGNWQRITIAFISSLIEMKLDQKPCSSVNNTRTNEETYHSLTSLYNQLIGGFRLQSYLSLTKRSENILSWRRNPNHELCIQSPRNKSARYVMRLLIHCMHVEHSRHFSTNNAYMQQL